MFQDGDDLDGGNIYIDDQDIAQVTQESLRSQIGVVTQDTSLLHRSIRENLLYGRPDATEEQLQEVIRRSHADEFIFKLVDAQGRRGLDAHVGERGVKLSGGQRQRIAIARMDRLVVLKHGKIVETGTHHELIARDGLYARLWNRQTGGFVGVDG